MEKSGTSREHARLWHLHAQNSAMAFTSFTRFSKLLTTTCKALPAICVSEPVSFHSPLASSAAATLAFLLSFSTPIALTATWVLCTCYDLLRKFFPKTFSQLALLFPLYLMGKKLPVKELFLNKNSNYIPSPSQACPFTLLTCS